MSLPGSSPSESPDRPDVDALVAALKAKVAERRASGDYPEGLEDDLTARFRHLLQHRATPSRPFDVRDAIRRMAAALPLRPELIPLESDRPGGSAVHKALAKLATRQTRGILMQVQAFAQPAGESIEALAEAVERLDRTLRDEVIPALDAVIERQAAMERQAAGSGGSGSRSG